MSIGGRHAPLSPVSLGGSEWSFAATKFQPSEGGGGPYPVGRGNLVSPPNSGGSIGAMSLNGFSSGPRSNGGPSPPPSVGRSSNGTNIYSGRSEGNRSSIRNDLDDAAILHEHYLALKAYLNARDPNYRPQPNKARDKLLRLSSVQFYELSTDVFDELIRRQAIARTPPNAPNGPPAFLLPEKTFHPKRNQARQRLSSLGPPRFKDLAADVFHELERRFPRFVGGEIPRGGSSMSSRGGGPVGRNGGPPAPFNGNHFPPRGPSRMRRTSDVGAPRGPPPAEPYGIPHSATHPGSDFGRPMPKHTNQNNTLVPNKSTMVEEDEGNGQDDDRSSPFGSPFRRMNKERKGKLSIDSAAASEINAKPADDYQAQARELRTKLEGTEDALRRKESEMSNALNGEKARYTALNLEKKEWTDVRQDLEKKLADAQNLNKSMKQKLDRVREDHDRETQPLRDQVADLQEKLKGMHGGAAGEGLRRENDELRRSLGQQQQVTEQVRREAQDFLREMRLLSQQSASTYEKQAEMERTIERLEREMADWRDRYARTKTQLRTVRTSSGGLTADEDAARYVRDKGFVREDGQVKDVHVTKFQMAVDDLLQTARRDAPDKVVEAMKGVVASVRRITRDLDDATPQPGDEAAQQEGSKLRAGVSSSANSLITASRNFAAAAGISPVSLLDAAASHLTVAVVDLLRAVKIRPTAFRKGVGAEEREAGDDYGEEEEEEEEEEAAVEHQYQQHQQHRQHRQQEDDDDDDDDEDEAEDSLTPVDPRHGGGGGFFARKTEASGGAQDRLPPPPPFQGLGGARASTESSAYSPVNSPRESLIPYLGGSANGTDHGAGYLELDGSLSMGPNGGYGRSQHDGRQDDLDMRKGYI